MQAIRHGSALTLPGRSDTPRSLGATAASALAINLLNPKIALFFLTFLPQFVSAGDPEAPAKLFGLGLTYIVVASPVVVTIILAADRVADTLRQRPRVGRALDWLFAAVFASFAAHLLLARAR